VTQAPQVDVREDWASDLSSADVASLLSTLWKSLRAFHMYESNNPVFQRFQQALRAEFERLWSKADELNLTVQEDGFGWGGELFEVGSGRDSLPFSFYKDGIRYLKFLPGFEAEVEAFLGALRRARQHSDDANDMVSVLWEEDFSCLQYGYVDVLSDGFSVPDTPLATPGPLGGSPLAAEGLSAEELVESSPGGHEGTPFAGGLSRDVFDETLYFLEPSETEALRKSVEIEMARDLHRDVLNALFDRLEEGGPPERQEEVLDILDQLLPLFLSRGELGQAARVLEELGRMTAPEAGADPALVERVDRLFVRLSDPQVLAQFVHALEEGAVSPDSHEVSLFFSRLDAVALPILVRFAEVSEVPAVSTRLAAAIDGLATRHPGAVVELLKSDDPVLVKGAARAAGRVKLAASGRSLGAILTHPERDVRSAAVGALSAIRTPTTLQYLIPALEDEDREVRISAAKALGAVRFASARDALAAAVADRHMKDADLTEKMAFFEAYGAVGGNAAVERLAAVLTGKGLFGRRAPAELRACAALGLGRVGTAEAREALERARYEEDLVVRNAVLRALRSELS
jgi:hypothetical protein